MGYDSAVNALPILQDGYGRPINYLRVSVTDRCNFKCFYCRPELDYTPFERPEILTFEEIERLTGLFVRLGLKKLRFTGGEPLVRRDLPMLAARIHAAHPQVKLCLTTNGVFLPEHAAALKAAGISGLNVSIDTLLEERLQSISGAAGIEKIFAGIQAAKAAGFQNFKLNMVLVRGVNDDEIAPMVAYAQREMLELRFVEFMPMGGIDWEFKQVVSEAEILAALEKIAPVMRDSSDPSDPARRFKLAGHAMPVGIIASVTDAFCDSCTRARVTSDGRLMPCLFDNMSTDLKHPLRAGASDDELIALMRAGVFNKPKGAADLLSNRPRLTLPMIQVGG